MNTARHRAPAAFRRRVRPRDFTLSNHYRPLPEPPFAKQASRVPAHHAGKNRPPRHDENGETGGHRGVAQPRRHTGQRRPAGGPEFCAMTPARIAVATALTQTSSSDPRRCHRRTKARASARLHWAGSPPAAAPAAHSVADKIAHWRLRQR